jgi:hypothetical protein
MQTVWDEGDMPPHGFLAHEPVVRDGRGSGRSRNRGGNLARILTVDLLRRGTLDPIARWQFFGHDRKSVFEMTRTRLKDHDAVVRVQSNATCHAGAHARYPVALRRGTAEEAAHVDGLLGDVRSKHPRCIFVHDTSCIDDRMGQAQYLLRWLAK